MQWKPLFHTDGQTDTTKLLDFFCNFANVPKKTELILFLVCTASVTLCMCNVKYSLSEESIVQATNRNAVIHKVHKQTTKQMFMFCHENTVQYITNVTNLSFKISGKFK
jgi:hypothetical protein